MINLLPPNSAKELRAARHNVALLHVAVGAGITLVLIALVYAATFVLMKSSEMSSVTSSQENQQKIARFNKIEAQAKEYTASLQLAKSLFGSETSYPTALHKIASAMPPGTVLQSLNLAPTLVGTPTTLSVLAKNKDAALAVKSKFETAGIAKDITIASITEGGNSGAGGSAQQAVATADYPVVLGLNLTFQPSIFTESEDTP